MGARAAPAAGDRLPDGGERQAGRHAQDRDDGNDDPDDGPQAAGLPPDPPPMGGLARAAWYVPGGSCLGNGTVSSAPSPDPNTHDPDAEPITGPQKTLIRSRAKKVGLTPYALESLAYQQFKVWKVEKLTKEQAASILDALDRDLKERATQEKHGAHGSAVTAHVA